MRIAILTLGSRGDVQPYVALGRGLKAAGFDVTLVTGRNFASFVTDHDLAFAPLDVDFLELAQDPTVQSEMKRRPREFMRKSNETYWRIMQDAWAAAQGSNAIVYHPKALAGYHIAEKLNIPGFASVPLPLLTPTRAFANPVLPPRLRLGGTLNRLSISLMLPLITAPYHATINRFRTQTLGLPPRRRFASERKRSGSPVPVLYPFSRHVVPVPGDWPDSAHVTGYWFLDHPTPYQPPADLAAFLAAGPPPVYVGFGSMTWNDPRAAGQIIVQALEQTGQRGILAAGWGGLAASSLPDSVCMVESVPHDWLFPQVAAVAHHGGAGTTAAGLRAGKPTFITPFMADQPFWGQRVHDLGVGPAPVPQKALTVERLADAIRIVTGDVDMRRRAASLGEKIRAENGVAQAVGIIAGALDVPLDT